MNDIITITCRSFNSLSKAVIDAGFTILEDIPDAPDPRHGDDPEPGTTWSQSGILTLLYSKCTKPLSISFRYFFDSSNDHMVFSYLKIINDGIMCSLYTVGAGASASGLMGAFGYIGPSGNTDWVCVVKAAKYSSALGDYVALRNSMSLKIDEDQGFQCFNPNFIPMPTPNSIHLVEYYMPENHIILDNVYACKQVPAYVLTNRRFINQHTNQYQSIPDFYDTDIPSTIYGSPRNQHWADFNNYGTCIFGERVKIDEQTYCIVPSYGQDYNNTTNEDYSDKSKYTNYSCFAYRLS